MKKWTLFICILIFLVSCTEETSTQSLKQRDIPIPVVYDDIQFITSEKSWEVTSDKVQVQVNNKGTGKITRERQKLDIHWRMCVVKDNKREQVVYSNLDNSSPPDPIVLTKDSIWLKILGKQKVGAQITALIPQSKETNLKQFYKLPKDSAVVIDFFILKAIDENDPPERPIVKDSDSKWQTLTSGVQLYFLKKGHGVKIKKNAMISLHYAAWTPKGNRPPRYSNHYGLPIKVIFGNKINTGLPPLWDKVAATLRDGDVVYAKIPYFGKDPKIKQGTTYYLKMEILDVIDGPVMPTVDEEDDKWESFPSGAKFYYITKGTGTAPRHPKAKITIDYTAWLENGQIFSSTLQSDTPYSFTLDGKEIIEGIKAMCQYLREGDSIYMKLPPHLAFGEKGIPGIPANSTVYYQFKVLNVQN